MTKTSGEWDAAGYHQVSAPQTRWGHRVLSRLALRGGDRAIAAIDAGTGGVALSEGRKWPTSSAVPSSFGRYN